MKRSHWQKTILGLSLLLIGLTNRAMADDFHHALFNTPAEAMLGNNKAPITLVEFFDYRCGVCRRIAPTINRFPQQNRDVNVIYRIYPILGPASEYVARAAIASQQQGKFIRFHNLLLSSSQPLTNNEVTRLANKAQLDVDQLHRDMYSNYVNQVLQETEQLANQLRIPGTPTFVVGYNQDASVTPYIAAGVLSHSELNSLISQLKAQRH